MSHATKPTPILTVAQRKALLSGRTNFTSVIVSLEALGLATRKAPGRITVTAAGRAALDNKRTTGVLNMPGTTLHEAPVNFVRRYDEASKIVCSLKQDVGAYKTGDELAVEPGEFLADLSSSAPVADGTHT
jgi:hypothetical protein